MKRSFLLIAFLHAALGILAQEKLASTPKNDSIVVGKTTVDSLYREDQFYVGFTFNLLLNKPGGISQSGFSGGLNLGFIRDIPINKSRTFGIGLGAGWAVNSYGLNMKIDEDDTGAATFEVIDEDLTYDSNRYTTYAVEVPFELRWRTSTPDSYKFWRIYAGFRLGYIYHFKSNYKGEGGDVKLTDITPLNRLRSGLSFTFGYNTFNFHVYYSLNQFFDANMLSSGENVGLNALKLGFVFYIL